MLFTFGCSKSDDNKEESSACLNKNFLESFIIKPNDCVIFNDNPDMTFTFLGFEPYTKSGESNIPQTSISGILAEDNFVWEFVNAGVILEDYQTEGISFSGRVHIGINNVAYTVFFDNIEFTETQTQFIFHKSTVRFGFYDSEFD